MLAYSKRNKDTRLIFKVISADGITDINISNQNFCSKYPIIINNKIIGRISYTEMSIYFYDEDRYIIKNIGEAILNYNIDENLIYVNTYDSIIILNHQFELIHTIKLYKVTSQYLDDNKFFFIDNNFLNIYLENENKVITTTEKIDDRFYLFYLIENILIFIDTITNELFLLNIDTLEKNNFFINGYSRFGFINNYLKLINNNTIEYYALNIKTLTFNKELYEDDEYILIKNNIIYTNYISIDNYIFYNTKSCSLYKYDKSTGLNTIIDDNVYKIFEVENISNNFYNILW